MSANAKCHCFCRLNAASTAGLHSSLCLTVRLPQTFDTSQEVLPDLKLQLLKDTASFDSEPYLPMPRGCFGCSFLLIISTAEANSLPLRGPHFNCSLHEVPYAVDSCLKSGTESHLWLKTKHDSVHKKITSTTCSMKHTSEVWWNQYGIKKSCMQDTFL